MLETKELLKKLITFKSETSNSEECNKIINFVKDYSEKNGLKTEVKTFNDCSSIILSLGNKTSFLMTGHLDVVEAKPEQYTPIEKDGKIYGRGSLDMKAGCAIAINTLIKLKENNYKAKVGVVLTTDEEIGGANGMGKLVNSLNCDFATALEPGHNNIVFQEKGTIWVQLTAKGVSAHASRPWLGKNAIDILYLHINELRELLPKSDYSTDEVKWVSTMNVGFIEGGKSPNKIPDCAVAKLDFRIVDEKDRTKILNKLKTFKEVSVKIIESEPMLYTDAKNTFIQKFSKTVEQVYGKKLPLAKEHGASDLRYLTDKGIPGVVFGPYGENYHGLNEWVSIENMLKIEKTYYEFSKLF